MGAGTAARPPLPISLARGLATHRLMLIGTHICTPLLAAGIWDWWQVARDRPAHFTRADLVFIGLGGILPDVLSLHVSLAARHASPVHSLWFPVGIAGILLVAMVAPAWRARWRTACLFLFGVAAHLFEDLISGGIPLWGPGHGIVGAYYVAPVWWVPLDAAMLLIAWFVFFRIRWLLGKGTLTCPTCAWEEAILARWRAQHTRASADDAPPQPAAESEAGRDGRGLG